MTFNDRETAMVLYALRKVQESLVKGTDLSEEGHFVEVEPLNADEIDDLCERINCDGDSEPTDDASWNPSFDTTCPYCRTAGKLSVIRAKISTGEYVTMSSPLTSDGFEVVLPKNCQTEDYSTEDETVQCGHCKKTFPLDEVTL